MTDQIGQQRYKIKSNWSKKKKQTLSAYLYIKGKKVKKVPNKVGKKKKKKKSAEIINK